MSTTDPDVPSTSPRRAFLSAIVLLGGLLLAAPRARAEGFALDGRTAPDLSFADAINGVAPGSTLSSYRGRVVWIKFWLRDCPHCRASMPKAQELHERWGSRGLVVITILHQYPTSDPTLREYLRSSGYDFPVVSDPTGSLAQRYGVNHRPTDYVIGIDGRVKASNGAPDSVIQHELGLFRLEQLGAMPAELQGVRDLVWNRDYAGALEAAEKASTADGAAPQVKDAAAKIAQLAREEVDARIEYANRLERRRQVRDAREIHDRLVERFQGTSLASFVSQTRAAFLSRVGG